MTPSESAYTPRGQLCAITRSPAELELRAAMQVVLDYATFGKPVPLETINHWRSLLGMFPLQSLDH